jgi:hypothetical protein
MHTVATKVWNHVIIVIIWEYYIDWSIQYVYWEYDLEHLNNLFISYCLLRYPGFITNAGLTFACLTPPPPSTSSIRPQGLLRLLKFGLAMFNCAVHGFVFNKVEQSLICLGKPAYNGNYVLLVIMLITTVIFSFRFQSASPFSFTVYAYLLIR